jgi:hypothetical protein
LQIPLEDGIGSDKRPKDRVKTGTVLSLKLQMKVISGSGYLKKIQRIGWFAQRTN